MKKPNLFIVGAPKCGTTSLYEYLRRHPDVFFPKIKEPNFFAQDLEIRSYPDIVSSEDFLALYKDVKTESILGDASQFHLFSKQAARKIKEFNPDSKIIIMIREPASMIHSLHNQYLSTGDEDVRDFHRAIALNEERRNGIRIPDRTLFPRCMAYFDIARYAAQIRRFYQAFGKTKVRVVLLDDFKQNTRETYLGVLDFLKIENIKTPFLLPFNARDQKGVITQQLEHHIKSQFADEVSELESLLGRDLSSWKA